MNWLKKIIPAHIEIRSLYWVEHVKNMNKDLDEIFKQIDIEENYEYAKQLISEFQERYHPYKAPRWVEEEYAAIFKAQAIVSFITYSVEDIN